MTKLVSVLFMVFFGRRDPAVPPDPQAAMTEFSEMDQREAEAAKYFRKMRRFL